LCGNCHRIRHWREKHGDATTYMQPIINVLPTKPTAYQSDTSRQCKRCRKILPLERFAIGNINSKHQYRKHTCKCCAARWSYLRRRINRGQLRLKAVEYMGGKCAICGFDKHQTVFDFHHLDTNLKEFNWQALSMRDWSVVKFELDKCIMLCHCCHRLEHKAIRTGGFSIIKEGSLAGLKVGN
jgi:hypothetical protein